jgi:hypothetical protein
MALKLLQPGVQPLGQFDGFDDPTTGFLTLKGGEVVTFASIQVSSHDKAAFDVFDGYVNPDKRVVVKKVANKASRPLMLADDGIAGYGTLFGSVVGGTVGQVTDGVVLGPHTASGSGKVTCWEKPGLYAVSLDACDTDAATGLQPTHPTLDTGAVLYATLNTGLLTPNDNNTANPAVGRFVDFESNGSLVNTPNYLVGALVKAYKFAIFYFNPTG